MKLKVTFFF